MNLTDILIKKIINVEIEEKEIQYRIFLNNYNLLS